MAALIIGEIDNIYNPTDEKVIGAVLSDRQVFAINDETREMIQGYLNTLPHSASGERLFGELTRLVRRVMSHTVLIIQDTEKGEDAIRGCNLT
tara:strand:+ start:1193 stop:1471 length:279 start_codon:yes stop_codon:yes gene_type:complete